MEISVAGVRMDFIAERLVSMRTDIFRKKKKKPNITMEGEKDMDDLDESRDSEA